MRMWRAVLLGLVVVAGLAASGCRDERREVIIRETQHESEVVDQSPGEMIVD